MVGTSGVIYPMMGLRRAAIHFLLMASMNFWMQVCSRIRISEYFCFVKRCMSSTLAIWAAVPAGFGTLTPRFGLRVNGSVGAMWRYSVGVMTMPM